MELSLKPSFEKRRNRKAGFNFTISVLELPLKPSTKKRRNRKVGVAQKEIYIIFFLRNSNFTISLFFGESIKPQLQKRNRKVETRFMILFVFGESLKRNRKHAKS